MLRKQSANNRNIFWNFSVDSLFYVNGSTQYVILVFSTEIRDVRETLANQDRAKNRSKNEMIKIGKNNFSVRSLPRNLTVDSDGLVEFKLSN